MRNRLAGILASLILILLLCSGIFADVIAFFAWLFALQYAAPKISIAGAIIVRILTFLVSYGLVGLIFNLAGLFNSKIMSVAYFIISTLLSFVLAYVVWAIEKYTLIIAIVMGVVLFGIVVYFVIAFIWKKKKPQNVKRGGYEND